VLLYELCEADVVCAQFRKPVEDTGLTGMEEGQVLGHLGGEEGRGGHVLEARNVINKSNIISERTLFSLREIIVQQKVNCRR